MSVNYVRPERVSLQDPDTKRRYEVEIQLGATDEAHVIRCIEYWDIERKRYPQHDHCAVIVAEDILSRFLNVISLFNGTIPLIAIQMQAYKVGEHFTLIFTKVLDELTRGPVDQDEEAEAAPTDRESIGKRRGPPRPAGSEETSLIFATPILIPNSFGEVRTNRTGATSSSTPRRCTLRRRFSRRCSSMTFCAPLRNASMTAEN
jgi:hypothetical protein